MTGFRPIIEVYHDPETDEFTVTGPSDMFDPFSTFDEQEAMDEAYAMADECKGEVYRI